MAIREFLAVSSKVGITGKGHQMKKLFGLQRHKLLTGDRHENAIDVLALGFALFAARAAMFAN